MSGFPKLEEWVRTRAQRVKDPSPRVPTSETQFNDADNVERHMREDGHRTWGLLIYRCTYGSDEQWKAFMDRLGYYINDSLAVHNGLDLMPSLDARVIDDPVFDSATPAFVRQQFLQWAETAPQIEQGDQPACKSQRYRYCLHVDQAALESVINGPPPPDDALGGGYVNLVFADSLSANDLDPAVDPAADRYWMRITYESLMVGWYSLFRSISWETEYRQPPQIGRP